MVSPRFARKAQEGAATVCLVSSGTGGHLTPALALAGGLRARGHRPVLVSEGRGVEAGFLGEEWGGGGDYFALGRIRAAGLADRARLPFAMTGAVRRAVGYLRQQRPRLVVSTGGSTAVPVGLAARALRIPICLVEQNAIAGRAHKLLQPFARRVYLGMPGDSQRERQQRDARFVLSGTPLRAGFSQRWRDASRRALGLDSHLPTVLVVGGSQGARYLNETVPQALMEGEAAIGPLQVLHLAGPGRQPEVTACYQERRGAGPVRSKVSVRGFCDNMPAALGAADLVVCRGGGSTLAELLAIGRPAVVVPYPHHKDMHQRANGEVLAHAGAAVVVDQTMTDAVSLRELLVALLVDSQRLEGMAMAAERLAKPDAVAQILTDLEQQTLLPRAARETTRGAGPVGADRIRPWAEVTRRVADPLGVEEPTEPGGSVEEAQ